MFSSKNLILIILSVLSFLNPAKAQTGILNGKVTDANNGEPLIGVNIIILELENTGTASDVNGYFELKLTVGSYSLKASLIGYTPAIKTDVIIKSGVNKTLNIQLSSTAIELEQVTVKGDYFDKAVTENNLSTLILGSEEVRRSPGSDQDFQRILQAMAGVSFSTDQTNELLVRGGSPNENLTVFDNMEIHSTNHYPNEMNSGGPINMINVDLIDDIHFSTGGFISKYGDKLSSVLVVNSREGTRIKDLAANLNLSMAGYGAVLEGQINEGKGSWILSARNSFLSLIAGSVGLTSIPYYYDLQFKAVYDLSPVHKLSFSGIYGNDKIDVEGEADHTNFNLANSKDSVDIGNVFVRHHQYAAGLSLKNLWTNSFYTLTSLYTNSYFRNIDVKFDFTQREYNGSGEVGSSKILGTRSVFRSKGNDGVTALKSEAVWNVNSWNEINFGGSVKTGNYHEDIFVDADTARYDINENGKFEALVSRPQSAFTVDYKLFDQFKYYGFINDKISLYGDRLVINAGFRYDYFSYSNKGNFSPRLSLSYYIRPNITSLNFSYGEFYQNLSYPEYGDRYNTEINRYLENSHARHFVFGIENILSDGLKLNLEGYYKLYDDIPVDETFIHYNDRTFRSEQKLSIGKQKIYGIDLLLQQKLVKDIYGTLCFSRMWSKFDDPRIGFDGKTFPSDYDFPYVVTLIVGKRFKDLRDEMNKLPIYLRIPTYILPFSNDMEISIRWRYASGMPYTPQVYTTYEQHRQGAVKWTSGTWVPSDNVNSARYPAYHRLDIAFSSRFNFNNWAISVFLSLQNIYNRKNIAYYQYISDGTIENVYQFSFLPVAGIEVLF
jgi:hypothetical protein